MSMVVGKKARKVVIRVMISLEVSALMSVVMTVDIRNGCG